MAAPEAAPGPAPNPSVDPAAGPAFGQASGQALGSAGASVPIESVQVSRLSKRYGHHRALAGVDLALHAGSLCALLGPNGAGKSTLLGILSTLVRPSGGSVQYCLAGGGALPARRLRREIGVLAHSSLVYGELSAVENLAFYGRLYRVADAAARAEALLDQVGLDAKARHRPARTYSRGMIQRLSLARALLHQPRILLLDEPFTGLDRTGAAALGQALARAKQGGCIMLVVTHDLESIAALTDHVAVLRRGKLVHEDRRPAGQGQASGGFSYDELKAVYHQHTE